MNNLKYRNAMFISINLVLLVAIVILFSSFISAQTYSRSFIGYTPYVETRTSFGDTSLGTGATNLFDRSKCGKGQDFILYVSPVGCTPSVVRSDLLEEQNVPVFCPIMATKLNPLISVDAIDSMSFRGQTPKEVSGVGYYPAQAALGKTGFATQQKIANNLGYAVIVLKKQKNESAMPNFVEGNLTARINYDIKNAFGVGNAGPFYLAEMNDEEWNTNFKQYGFWQGRGYLRAEEIDEDGQDAVISVYSDREGSGLTRTEKRVVADVSLKKGEISREIFIPGFDYCSGSLQLRLDGLEAPDTTVRLNVNGDYIELKKGEKFIENKCQITDIDKRGIVQAVSGYCREDTGRKSFYLTINPRVNITIDGVEREYSVGDVLLDGNGNPFSYVDNSILSSDKVKSVFLVYLTTEGNTNKEANMIAGIVAVPGTGRAKLDDSELKSFAGAFKRGKGGDLSVLFVGQKIFSFLEKGLRNVISGDDLKSVSFNKESEVFDKKIILKGFSGAKNEDLNSEDKKVIKENYENALKEYDAVLKSFNSEKYPEGEIITLGQQALTNLIELSWNLNQKKATLEFCSEFREKYPNGNEMEICSEAEKFSSISASSQSAVINNRVYSLSMQRINEPTSDEYGAVVSVKMPDGKTENFEIGKEEIVYLDLSQDGTDEFIQLIDVDKNSAGEESVKIRTNLREGVAEAVGRVVIGSETTFNLRKGFPDSRGSYTFSLEKVNLKKVARVSVIAKINRQYTEATFPFKIGIEKRANLMKLSPEKTRERINKLNSTISKWKSINDKLGNVVRAGKAACFATGTYLSVKNFFANIDGRGIAREKIMNAKGGWFEFCEKEVSQNKYSSVDKCLIENSDKIEQAVNETAGIIKKQNDNFKQLQQTATTKISGGESVVDTNKLMGDYMSETYKKNLENSFKNVDLNSVSVGGKEIPVSDIINSMNSNTTLITQARDIELYSNLLSSDDEVTKNIARKELNALLGDVWANSEEQFRKTNIANVLPDNLKSLGIALVEDKDSIKIIYDGGKTGTQQGEIPANVPAQIVVYRNGVYVVELEEISGKYRVKEVYSKDSGEKLDNSLPIYTEIKTKFVFEKFDKSSYNNKCTNCVLRYYESGEYKGYPAIVPFSPRNRELGEGWYVGIKSVVPIGGTIKPYDESGRVSSFWLCNVGQNGREEFDILMSSGKSDDICQMINRGTGQPYNQFPGISEGDALNLVEDANNAIAQAQRAYKSGVKEVSILGKIIKVGEPALGIPGIKCQEFMSPKECSILFNVCDPFICPSSRCDMGGTYPVSDVIQSGIAGSIALCLPNAGEVAVPICVSGVHAGIDGYLSVVQSYRDCLQTSLDTGQQVGICDKLNSVYMCEFFWRQSVPIVKYSVPSVLSKIVGQGTRGGGEYLGFKDAWTRAGNSMNYFTQYYAANSYNIFKSKNIEGAGSEFCRNWISVPGVKASALIDALTSPDSPPQFFGNFDEIPFTTITIPATSHYKVFYHIYSGKELPAYYEIYLRGETSSFYQDVPFRRVVARGFIPVGERKSETLDFTAQSGYKEMCIVVNNQEECGFKEVTTDFAFDYLSDKYVQQQVNQTEIRTTSECISGTSNAYNLLDLNIQSGAEEFIDPAIYNRGITRICSTDNPGKTSDAYIGTEKQRWVEVGYCDNPTIKCWIDKHSIREAIEITNISNQAVQDIEQNIFDTLNKNLGLFSDEEFDKFVEEINKPVGENEKLSFLELNKRKIAKINENFAKAFYSNQKGYLTLLRGNLYKEIAGVLWKRYLEPEKTRIDENETLIIGEGGLVGAGDMTDGKELVEQTKSEIKNIGTEKSSLIFQFDDGRLLTGQDIYYVYSGDNWYWCLKDCYDENKKSSSWWLSGLANYSGEFIGEGSTRVEAFLGMPILNKENKESTLNELAGKTFEEGFNNMIDRVIANEERGFLSLGNNNLIVGNVRMTHEGIFLIEQKNRLPIGFKFETSLSAEEFSGFWKWTYNGATWISVSDMPTAQQKEIQPLKKQPLEQSTIDLINSLENKNFIDGALIIFGVEKEIAPVSEIEGECTTREECQKLLGEKIIEIAQDVKSEKGIIDSTIQSDTEVKNFECLVLAVAMQESTIQHCGTRIGQGFQVNGNPLYCDGIYGEVLGASDGKGVLQINTKVYRVDASVFEENVRYGAELLLREYNSRRNGVYFAPTGKNYNGWSASLRAYNGLGFGGENLYVEKVLGRKSEIIRLFSEFCGEEEEGEIAEEETEEETPSDEESSPGQVGGLEGD